MKALGTRLPTPLIAPTYLQLFLSKFFSFRGVVVTIFEHTYLAAHVIDLTFKRAHVFRARAKTFVRALRFVFDDGKFSFAVDKHVVRFVSQFLCRVTLLSQTWKNISIINIMINRKKAKYRNLIMRQFQLRNISLWFKRAS
jgi:hypothetical protein